jgi:hypothetical protein
MKVLMTLSPTLLRGLIKGFGANPLALKSLIGGALVGAAAGVTTLGLITKTNIAETLFFMDLHAEMISTDLERRIVEHNIAGREGEVLQDLGGKSANIEITGKWIYENDPGNDVAKVLFGETPVLANLFRPYGWNWMRVELFKALIRLGLPMVLSSDLFVGPVIIKRERFKYVGGVPNVYDYHLSVKEWNPALSVVGTSLVLLSQLGTGSASRGH